MIDNTYEIILDYELQYLEKAVEFLNKSNKDIGWSLEDMYRKLSNKNPSGKGYLAVAMHNKEIVGTASLTKKTALIKGVMVEVAEVGDTYTHPQFRRILKPRNYYRLNKDPESYVNKSMFGRLLTEVRDAALKDGVEIIYGTPNENSYPGYTKHLGFVPTEKFKINSYCNYKLSYIWKKIAIKFKLNFLFKTPETVNLEKNTASFQEEYSKFILKIFENNYDFIIYKEYNYLIYRYLSNNNYFFDKYYIDGILSCLIVYKIKIINNINYIFIAEVLYNNINIVNEHIKLLLKIKFIDVFVIWTDSITYRKFKLYKQLFLYRKNIPIIIYDCSSISKVIVNSKNLSFGLGCTDNV